MSVRGMLITGKASPWFSLIGRHRLGPLLQDVSALRLFKTSAVLLQLIAAEHAKQVETTPK
jgi:hypothetical protein